MSTWKSKVFGDNRFNFYGWIVVGLLVIGVSFWCIVKAIQAGADRSPACMLLGGIFVIMLGRFGITLQNYCARVAEKIEAEDAKKNGDKAKTTLA